MRHRQGLPGARRSDQPTGRGSLSLYHGGDRRIALVNGAAFPPGRILQLFTNGFKFHGPSISIELEAGVDSQGRILARPIRPDDEPKVLALLQRVSKEDLRLRFFDSIKEFKHEFLAKLTQLDYSHAIAFVAFDEGASDMIGVVRLYSDPIYENGEFAILLRSDRKGRGLGWALMQLIVG
jgi:hypothetical protein